MSSLLIRPDFPTTQQFLPRQSLHANPCELLETSLSILKNDIIEKERPLLDLEHVLENYGTVGTRCPKGRTVSLIFGRSVSGTSLYQRGFLLIFTYLSNAINGLYKNSTASFPRWFIVIALFYYTSRRYNNV
ncbi:hypothetical protein CEXT_600451 [Caerostris extrusa]|uniref:Uncharacterized protein n=1 Tax=Caerostris extrusa TaxID=172846 RepID=A0AAV4XTP0_CAEEX|nr:hypothetical protein CEXT_600451 [Caerostris extrusa]